MWQNRSWLHIDRFPQLRTWNTWKRYIAKGCCRFCTRIQCQQWLRRPWRGNRGRKMHMNCVTLRRINQIQLWESLRRSEMFDYCHSVRKPDHQSEERNLFHHQVSVCSERSQWVTLSEEQNHFITPSIFSKSFLPSAAGKDSLMASAIERGA